LDEAVPEQLKRGRGRYEYRRVEREEVTPIVANPSQIRDEVRGVWAVRDIIEKAEDSVGPEAHAKTIQKAARTLGVWRVRAVGSNAGVHG